nr:MAG TPA: hypothetical protein [Caudoviricetes sp.]
MCRDSGTPGLRDSGTPVADRRSPLSFSILLSFNTANVKKSNGLIISVRLFHFTLYIT